MSSGLRAKLSIIAASSGAPAVRPAPAVHPAGVLMRSFRAPLDKGLCALDPEGLRRIGWPGRIFRPERCAFLDTETTGLSGGAGTVAFLIGVGFIEGETFVVEQYLMRDYPDEAELLHLVSKRLEGCESICTFNGNTFDLPLLRARFAMYRMDDATAELIPLDLIHPARRAWKLRLGSCRLADIETKILGLPRERDLPGSEVPQRYFEYLKSGDMALLEDIIEHNRQDILTLGTLLERLCALYAQPERERRREDLLSLGKALEKQGELGRALGLYRIAAVPAPAGALPLSRKRADGLSAEAAWRAFLLQRRSRNIEGMRASLEQMVTRGWNIPSAYIELSKLWEHRLQNPRRALRYALIARKSVPKTEIAALDARIARLNKKLSSERKNTHGPL